MLALVATSHDAHEYLPARSLPAQHEAGSCLGQRPAAQIRAIPAREDVFLDGDEATHVFEILSGIICAYRLLPDGQRHVICFYYPGDMIGYCTDDVHSFSAQALTPVRVRSIPRTAFEREMQQRPELAQSLLRIATRELSATRDHLLCMAAKSAEARMASFLLALSRRNAMSGENPLEVRLPMTRLDIADYLGLTIETVSRIITKFKRRGLIELPRATQVVIRNLHGLSALVDA
jgi:CRP/FNR family transcriptional regulator